MKVYLGADHRGYRLKENVAKWLFEWKYDFKDLGAEFLDTSDDYTNYASKVASMVAKDKDSRGILLCGSGVGVDIVANKFDGVRASIGKSDKQIIAGRSDDDMNVLVLAADFTTDSEAREMVKVFLETDFSNKKRFKRRLSEISKMEENN